MQNYQSYKTDLAPAIPASRDGLGRILAVYAGTLISFTPQEFIHPQELTLYSSQDLTGINFEVTYTDKFNHLQTVYINGAASNTVKHTNIWFKKIHSIKASANINSVLEIGYYGCIYLLDPLAYSFYFLRLTEDINLEIVKNLGFSSCYLYVIPDNHIINFNFNYLVSGGGSITPPISPYIVHIITIDSTYFMNIVGSASSDSSGSTMTNYEILAALKTVDGTGSGLDADLLDGLGAAEFAVVGHTHLEYEPAFSKNTAFNKNFGAVSGTVSEGNHNHAGIYEPVFIKNTAFNKNFGSAIGTVSEGNHSHAGIYEPVFTKNTAFNKNFGTGSDTVCQGNDARLSDARTPSSHAASHTNGTDDIQNATASQKGLMTSTQAAKLDGIESGATASLWKSVTAFTATPASTSTLTLTSDLTATIKPGVGLRYTISGTFYYGIVTAITSNLLTIAGAPLSGSITALSWLTIPLVTKEFAIAGAFADASDTALLEHDLNLVGGYKWYTGRARLVMVGISARDDSGTPTTQPSINVTIAGSEVLSTALTIPDGVYTQSVVAISSANYDVNYGEAIELKVTAASGGTPANDAKDLTAVLVFVPEVS